MISRILPYLIASRDEDRTKATLISFLAVLSLESFKYLLRGQLKFLLGETGEEGKTSSS